MSGPPNLNGLKIRPTMQLQRNIIVRTRRNKGPPLLFFGGERKLMSQTLSCAGGPYKPLICIIKCRFPDFYNGH